MDYLWHLCPSSTLGWNQLKSIEEGDGGTDIQAGVQVHTEYIYTKLISLENWVRKHPKSSQLLDDGIISGLVCLYPAAKAVELGTCPLSCYLLQRWHQDTKSWCGCKKKKKSDPTKAGWKFIIQYLVSISSHNKHPRRNKIQQMYLMLSTGVLFQQFLLSNFLQILQSLCS